MTIDSVLLGRQCKAEVKAARDAEKIRRAALPKEEKTDLPKLIDFLESLLLNIPEGAERAKKAFWIKKYTLGRTPSANPDAMIVAPKYEAWPIGEIPAWIKESFARQTWYWNVLCQPVQHELRLLKAHLQLPRETCASRSHFFQLLQIIGVPTKNHSLFKVL